VGGKEYRRKQGKLIVWKLYKKIMRFPIEFTTEVSYL
jgi:hypothetical protein